MKHASLALVCMMATSCAAVPPIETASGRPECTIEGVERQVVHSTLMEEFLANAWTLRDQTENQLVFWKESTDVMANAFMGSSYDPTTTVEVRLVLTGPPNETRVFGQIAYLTNEGSAFEQRTDVTTGKAGHELWQALVRLEHRLESQEPVPPAENQAELE